MHRDSHMHVFESTHYPTSGVVSSLTPSFGHFDVN